MDEPQEFPVPSLVSGSLEEETALHITLPVLKELYYCQIPPAALGIITESQNGWVGRHLKAHLTPPWSSIFPGMQLLWETCPSILERRSKTKRIYRHKGIILDSSTAMSILVVSTPMTKPKLQNPGEISEHRTSYYIWKVLTPSLFNT